MFFVECDSSAHMCYIIKLNSLLLNLKPEHNYDEWTRRISTEIDSSSSNSYPKKHLWHEVINDRYQKCAYLSEAGQFIIIFHYASKRSIQLLRMLHTSKKVVIHLTAFS